MLRVTGFLRSFYFLSEKSINYKWGKENAKKLQFSVDAGIRLWGIFKQMCYYPCMWWLKFLIFFYHFDVITAN